MTISQLMLLYKKKYSTKGEKFARKKYKRTQIQSHRLLIMKLFSLSYYLLFIYLVESNWPYERRHRREPSVEAEKVFGVSIAVMEANLSNWLFRS